MSDKQVEFKGRVARCVYSSPDFKTYAMDVDINEYPYVKQNKYRNVSIIGSISDLTLGVEYEVTATEEESKYGTSYRVVNIRRDVPTTAADTKFFLEEILTPTQASVLYAAYPDIIDIVKNDRCDEVDLNKLHGIGEKTFEVIKNKIIDNFKLADLVAEFKGTVSLSMLRKIYSKYSDVNVLREKLKTEPYKTLTRISGVGFKTADSIILDLQKEGIIEFGYDVETSEDRCLACIVYLLQENENNGNTKANLADIRSECIKMIPSSVKHFASSIKDDAIYYNKDSMSIALKKTYEDELYIAKGIADNLDNVSKNDDVWNYDVEKYRMVEGFELSDEQMKAVDNLCKHTISILNGGAGCVDCDTEFFNGTEWKRIADYEEGDRVLQYNEDGTAELVEPLAYIKQPSEYLWHFKTKYGLDQCLSDNHNCYYITSKGNLYHKTFKEVRENHKKTGFKGMFITTFDYSGNGINLSDDEIRLMVATFADGSFYNEEHYGKKTRRQARYHLKKERKKKRLTSILNRLNIKYRKTKSAAYGYDDFYANVPFRAKHFPKEWYNCNKHQLKVIADEVMYWDGRYSDHNEYSTTCKEDADFIQFVYSSLGYRATIYINDRVGEEYLTCGKIYRRKSVEYMVRYTNRNLVGMCSDKRKNHKKTEISQYKTIDGYEYCFTVPSHMLVLRRNNKIFITGNCGKSFSTQAVINMLDDNNKNYILLSPTGKAAKILSEFTHRPASTVHRGLYYNPKTGWGYNKYNKLQCDVVVVDEFSMCDVSLCRHLFEAIDFNDTRLLIVGDNAQLPSVGCGNLLHDFMESKVIPTTTLTKVFRYGEGGLSKVATDTRFCKLYLDNSMKGKATSFGKSKDYTFIDMSQEDIPKSIVSLYKKLYDNGIDVGDIQVLTAKNVGNYGTIVLNNMIQRAINPNYGSEACMKIGNTTYYKGDVVIQKTNEYNASLVDCDDETQTASVFNGESGVIEYVCGTYAILNFDGIRVKYEKSDMLMVGLGYAITSHRAQGSSIKNVIMCTPRADIYMLDSNLIYVMLTRMKEHCYHFGSVDTVNMAVKKKANLVRHTFMQRMLKNLTNNSK